MMTKKPKSISADTTNSSVAAITREGARDRRTTRKVQLIGLLNRKAGADVATIGKKFGWQPHTTRAALSGLRKDGHTLIRDADGTGNRARYRISQASREKTAHASVKEEAANAG